MKKTESSIQSTFSTIVNLHHIDAAARIFYPRLFELCQESLEKLLATTDLGMPVDWIYKTKKFPVIIGCEANYLDPIVLNEEITIQIHCVHIGKTSFQLEYHFSNQKNQLKAKAKTIHVFTKNGMKKMDLPKNWISVLSQLKV